MFGISLHELLVIAVVALVVVDPQKVPEIARALGALIYKWQRTFNELSRAIKTDEALRALERELPAPARPWTPEPEASGEPKDTERKGVPDA